MHNTKRLRHNARNNKDIATEGYKAKEPGVGTGKGSGSKAALELQRRTLFVCSVCSFFVYWSCASRGRDRIAPGDGCGSERCAGRVRGYRRSRYAERQMSCVRGLEEGKMRLVAPPKRAKAKWETLVGSTACNAAIEKVRAALEAQHVIN